MHVPPEVVSRAVDLAFTAVSAAGGWALSECSRHRQAADESRQRRRRCCLDLARAVGVLQALMAAHRNQWLTPRARMFAAADALAEVAVMDSPTLSKGVLPVVYRTLRRWGLAETDAGRSQAFPAMLRVNTAMAEVLLLGDPDLSAAAQDGVDAMLAAIAATTKSTRTRNARHKPLEDAIRAFGRKAGSGGSTPSRRERASPGRYGDQ